MRMRYCCINYTVCGLGLILILKIISSFSLHYFIMMVAALCSWAFLLISFGALVLGNSESDKKAQGGNVDTNTEAIFKPAWRMTVEEKLAMLPYGQYLNDVFQQFMSDDAKGFYKKILKEFRSSGSSFFFKKKMRVAEQIERLPERIRSKLDEAKRVELTRLLSLHRKIDKFDVDDDEIVSHVKKEVAHVDVSNLSKFGPRDLRNLILETKTHLEALDYVRRESFKQYGMHKHLELEELLNRLSPQEREKYEMQLEEIKKQHKRQKPMYLPLSKQHLLDVWEEMDHMNRENFHTKAFFLKHDLDGNGMWDENESKIVLEKDVHRYYNSSAPDYDPKQKEEELERMREYMYAEVDVNKDRFIDLNEFIEHTKRKDISDVEFWESLENANFYTEEEYEEYANQHRDEVNAMIDAGKIALPQIGDGEGKNVTPVSNF